MTEVSDADEPADEQHDELKFLGRTINSKDALRFLRQHTKNRSHCPICNGHRWVVTLTATGKYGGIPFMDDDRNSAPSGRNLPVFFTICNSCGYVNLHSLYVLHRWLESEVQE